MKIVADAQGLGSVIEKILERFPKEGIILLQGDLASGKTTLVKAFVKALGIEEGATSPTFMVQQCYGDRVCHYDIYNEGTKKFVESGLLEELERPGYHFIEWADEDLKEILEHYGFDYLTIEIVPKEGKREYRLHYEA
ncbi:MAG: tRNA (adenosine(37)-N6)-threonylcarbamoyltransferase complex ATPase subunit type 1 TsaE [Campylobacteraceae bacterium 4484_4]|nr:MAG: tRNA (adenosine(37)-N6)-threonylcarbamoyltransferase complex ATPase subunit type 1 TsaE [Campylobacteraceae bacterium 4484_4]